MIISRTAKAPCLSKNTSIMYNYNQIMQLKFASTMGEIYSSSL